MALHILHDLLFYYCRLSGESPFGGRTEEETFANVAYCRYDAHSIYENVTKEALKFIFKVLKRIPR